MFREKHLIYKLFYLVVLTVSGFCLFCKPVDAALPKGVVSYCGFDGVWGDGGWTYANHSSAGPTKCKFDKETKFYGKSSVRIDVNAGESDYVWNVYAPMIPEVGKTYVVRFYMKISGDGKVDCLALAGNDEKNTGYIEFEDVGAYSYKGTCDWQGQELIVKKIPEGTTKIHLYLRFKGPGTVWFDEVSVAEEGVDVPLGGQKLLTDEDYAGIRFDDNALPLNLIQNPGFEQGLTNWDSQTSADSGFIGVIDTLIFHSGKKSFRYDGSEERSGVTLQPRVRIDPRRSYELKVWIKSSDLTMPAHLQVLGFLQDGTPISYHYDNNSMELFPTIGTSKWTEKSLIIDSFPPEIDNIAIYLVLRDSEGKVWFDDITFRPLSMKSSQKIDK